MLRALLVGSQTGELSGVANDLAIMTSLLESRGFEIRLLTGGDATRGGIIDGYERLIADSGPDDAAVVYYSGHGLTVSPAGVDPAEAAALMGTSGPPPDLQAIVPTDFAESTETDFRGITAVELSVLLARLTDATRNATVILDCCYAAHMSRDTDLLPKALPHPSYLDIAAHLGRQRRASLPVDQPHPVSNPHAVRVVAAAAYQSAYEHTNADGVRCGLLTDTLRVAFTEAGDLPVTWDTLLRAVRARIARSLLGQRPDVEGPRDRLPFELREATRSGVLPVVPLTGNRVSLPGGRLVGVEPGDEFSVMPAGAATRDPATEIGTATVTAVGTVAADATVAFRPGHDTLPLGAEAHPARVAGRRQPIRVYGDGSAADDVRAAITAAPQLRLATATDPLPIAEVAVGERLRLRDRTGPLAPERPADPAGIAGIVADLEHLSRAATLRALEPTPAEQLPDPFTVEWGRVVDGQRRALPPGDERLHVDEPVYLRLRNDSDRNLFFFVFDIGVHGRVELLTAADPSGLRLRPGQEETIGADRGGTLTGLPLRWPSGAVADGTPRGESLLVIVTSTEQDLSVLRQDGIRGGAAEPATRNLLASGSSLERLLAQVATGAVRDLAPPSAAPVVRYATRHLTFLLDPAPAPSAETVRFLVDERPDASVRQLAARGAAAAPATAGAPASVAVRLPEIVVHRNRALRSADIRVDTLVVTGADGDTPAYRAASARFSGIRDETRLPMDNMLIYHGPAVGFLDIAVFLSRDRAGSLELSQLLQDQLTAAPVQQAAVQVAGLAVAAPQAAVAVAVVGASAVLVNTAYRLLSKAVGDSIGLYRTSLLASEGFGVGRHPAGGLLRAQDYSFAYEVVPA
ncbi:caspase family protein [Micromonospora sp. AP08]|uniref:caspase family protein n=1 Tax=Micromonospora sp. AP08 TaxID=2604467 RepID=UPI0016526F2F|nr:caspase family protein [Micromonospora sp. AP08]